MVRMLILALCAWATALAGASFAQAPTTTTPAEKARIGAIVREYLIENPEVIQEALDALEQRRIAALRTRIEGDGRHHAIGPKTAPVTIVEFFDYRCGYCKAAMDWVLRVQRTRSDVRIVFKEYPVLGPASLEASQAAIASLRQGGDRYFRFHQALMSHRGEMNREAIDRLARTSGVDVTRMRRDMADPGVARLIQDNYALGSEANVQGTPAFMINGRFVYGYDERELDRLLREVSATARRAG